MEKGRGEEGGYGKIKFDWKIYTPNVIHKTRKTTLIKTQQPQHKIK